MKYLASNVGGRAIRFVHQQAAMVGCTNLAVITHGEADIVAGDSCIEEVTGFKLKDQEVRGSILPALDGRWVVASIDPRTPLVGPKKQGFKSMMGLAPTVAVDIARAAKIECDVPRVQITNMANVRDLFLKDKPKYVSIDIEGRGADIHLVGVGWSADQAFVVPWDPAHREMLNEIVSAPFCIPIFHNANYDVRELEVAGITKPVIFEDTMVLGALYNPSLKKGLQAQVLSWVEGATAWKGLVNHRDPEGETPKVRTYRRLWTEILTRLGRRVPRSGWEWYAFYNGLDVAYTFRLHAQLRAFIEQQGRLSYYDDLLRELHPHLIAMGQRGLPVDEEARRTLRRAYKKREDAAAKRLQPMGQIVLDHEAKKWADETARLRAKILEAGRKLGDNQRYTSARSKATLRKKNAEAGFNFDAPGQRAQLVYDYLRLPETRAGRSTERGVLEELRLRLLRVDEHGKPAPACKPKVGTCEEAAAILADLIESKECATIRRNFLSMPLNMHGRLETEYHLHRTTTGRLSSGTASDDTDKKEKKQQLQNWPSECRKIVVAPDGYILVGGDWSNIEWAIVQWYAIRVRESIKKRLRIPLDFHQKLLDRFLRGELDAHRYLAGEVFQTPEEDITPAQRKRCKAYTHGLNFYGSCFTIARQAGHTQSMGKLAGNAHKKVFKPQGWWEETLGKVRAQQFVDTILGWRRWFFEMDPKPTEILGTQIQGTAADVCKYALLRIFRECPLEWEILTSTHDSVLMLVPARAADEAVNWLKARMEMELPFLDGLSLPAEVSHGKTWQDVK